jgi:hypothetical protein
VEESQRDDYLKKVADLLRPKMHRGTITQHELKSACVIALNQIRDRADG